MMKFYGSKGNSIFLILTLLLIGEISVAVGNQQVAGSSPHFITVWQGENGQNHMNIKVVSGILDQLPLSVGDEIAVYSGTKCVGATILTSSINSLDNSTFPNISASQDDGSNNGFIENDVIIFKIWDSKNQKELQTTSVNYRSDNPFWSTSGKFNAGATSVVEIDFTSGITQTINFINGNNLFSTYLVPTDPDMSIVLKTLKDQGYLISVQDESGNSYSYSNKNKVWTNNIGSIQMTEGYLINLNSNCSLQINGNMINLPLDIPLHSGWNYISIPVIQTLDAMKMVQPLIDQNILVKVQDEKGNSIEKLRKSGAWINNVGTFYPGKAYKINVSSSAVLRFQ